MSALGEWVIALRSKPKNSSCQSTKASAASPCPSSVENQFAGANWRPH